MTELNCALRNNNATVPTAADSEQAGRTIDARTASPDPLLKDREAAQLLEVSHATFWRRVNDGTVPPPIKETLL